MGTLFPNPTITPRSQLLHKISAVQLNLSVSAYSIQLSKSREGQRKKRERERERREHAESSSDQVFRRTFSADIAPEVRSLHASFFTSGENLSLSIAFCSLLPRIAICNVRKFSAATFFGYSQLRRRFLGPFRELNSKRRVVKSDIAVRKGEDAVSV